MPYFRNRRETAEHIWLTVRGWLADNGMPTSRRRIQALVAEIDGADHFIAVDHPEPFEDEPVLLMLESADGARVHICTLTHGFDDIPPWTLPLDERWRVVDFE